MKITPALFLVPFTSLALFACQQPTSAPTNPYSNGVRHPWQQATTDPQTVLPLINGYLSDQKWNDASNGWGPVELDTSNGENTQGDGKPITIGGTPYAKGIGAHAGSAITYTLDPANDCTTFSAVVGLDDEIRSQSQYGSVTFQIWMDGTRVWESGLLKVTGTPASQTVSVPVTAKSSLELRVTNGEDDATRQNWYDHADWADARIECGSTVTPPPTTPPASSSWVMGYYVGYLADRQPVEAIDWNGLTHLVVGINLPKADGSIDTSGAFSATTRAQLIRTAHEHGRKALAMIGGENTASEWLEATNTHRATFVTNLTELVLKEGFDGLDLDWEPLETNQQPALLSLTKELRTALPNAILSFPTDGAFNPNFQSAQSLQFYAELAPLVDQINLMTYGMSGAYQGWKTWHSSALYPSNDPTAPTSVAATVEAYLKAGVPAKKLGVGIGFYGLCYGAPATKPLMDTTGIRPEGAKLMAGDNDISYANIVTEYAPLGTRTWDSNARVPYLSFATPSGSQGCTYISYEDEQSIFEKAQYVKDKGLGGAIIWNINEGYVRGRTPANPLLDVTRRAFQVRP